MLRYVSRPIRLVAILALSVCLIQCAEKPTEPPQTITSLKILSPSSLIYSGSTVKFLAMATISNGTQSDVTEMATWSVAPGHAGTINPNGVFTATGNTVGSEVIRADYQGQRAEAQIEITERAVSLLIWPTTATVTAGQTLQLEAIAEFQNVTQEYVTNKVAWRITPGLAATIDTNGVLSSKTGAFGEETIIGSFQALSVPCRVQIKANYESPFEMVTIPPGSFVMGDDNGNVDEKPAHEVYVSAFQIGKFEVTNRQYVNYLNAVLKTGEIVFESNIVTALKGPFAGKEYCRITSGPEFPDRFIEYAEVESGVFEFQALSGAENYPVVRVHWWGAAAFCAFYGLRLPTEAEWEKASRGGQQLNFGTRDGTLNHELANYVGTSGRDQYESLAPSGSFPPNPFGMYDMSGNAAEYVFDLYNRNYYSSSPGVDPTGPGPKTLTQNLQGAGVSRGGAWTHDENSCRSAVRIVTGHQVDPNYLTGSIFGFRVARSLE